MTYDLSNARLRQMVQIAPAIDAAGKGHVCDAGLLAAMAAELLSLRASEPGVKGLDIADTCDGVEQAAFEAWAAGEKYEMHEHPLHYIFLDPKTDAARMGWKAGITHARSRILSALWPIGSNEPVRWEVIETLPSGVNRWHVVEHEHHAKALAKTSESPATARPLYASPQPKAVTITDEMVERAARAIAGTAYEGVYFTTRSRENYIDAEWSNHETDARTALTAALSSETQK